MKPSIRPLTIEPATNGYIVTIACMTLVFDSYDALLRELKRYLMSPLLVEQEYCAVHGVVNIHGDATMTIPPQ